MIALGALGRASLAVWRAGRAALGALGRALSVWVDATFGRRLMARIWMHGVLLFVGVLLTVLAGRHLLADVDDASTLRAHPYLARAAGERVLAARAHPAALADELARANRHTPLRLAVFSPAGAPLPGSPPSLPPPTAEELSALRPAAPATSWRHHRMLVAAYDGARLDAVVVLVAPAPPSLAWHVVVLLLCALGSAFVFAAGPLALSIARPLGRLRALTRKLGAGDLSVRARWRRRDELGDLARSFDAMAEQLQKLRAAERQLLGDVSHELRTPLSRMRVVLALAEGAELPRARAYLAEITSDLGELEQLVEDIITSLRLDNATTTWAEAQPPLHKERVAAVALVEHAAERFRARWERRALEVHAGALAGAVLEADLPMLRRALDNLLDNARKYSPDDTAITLRAERRADPAGDRLRLTVIDHGAGIPAEAHASVFTPFFRADPSRARSSGGVGLGLALARRIVLAHGGVLDFESREGEGSRFWIELPLRDDPGHPG
ncbi:MAG: HAMP domain-containing sensor histidine kinase [Kofleriaceae bacterium]